MKILNTSQIFHMLKQESITILVVASDESELSDFIKNDQNELTIEFRKLINKEERSILKKQIRSINGNFKNNIATTKNWKSFFEGNFINGMEDFYGLQIDEENNNAVILSTSDFGTRLIYTRENISVENISQKDVEDILLGVDLIDKAATDVELAVSLKEKIIIEKRLIDNNNKKSSKLKF